MPMTRKQLNMPIIRRCSAGIGATSARRSFASQHRSVQVPVAGGVSLHALAPEPAASDARETVLCLPSAFGAQTRTCSLLLSLLFLALQ